MDALLRLGKSSFKKLIRQPDQLYSPFQMCSDFLRDDMFQKDILFDYCSTLRSRDALKNYRNA